MSAILMYFTLPGGETFWPTFASLQNCCAVANLPYYKHFGLASKPIGEHPPRQPG
jgi:hypothetical protein